MASNITTLNELRILTHEIATGDSLRVRMEAVNKAVGLIDKMIQQAIQENSDGGTLDAGSVQERRDEGALAS